MQKFANDMVALVGKIRCAAGTRHGSVRETRTATRSLLQQDRAQRRRNGQQIDGALRQNMQDLRQRVERMQSAARETRHATGADIREAERIWRKG